MADNTGVSGTGEIAIVLVNAEFQTLAMYLESKSYGLVNLIFIDPIHKNLKYLRSGSIRSVLIQTRPILSQLSYMCLSSNLVLVLFIICNSHVGMLQETNFADHTHTHQTHTFFL